MIATAKPIIFKAPMIRALLDGSKTQTRRTLKRQPDITSFVISDSVMGPKALRHLAKYATGDLLWVREAWRIGRWNETIGAFALDYCDGPRKDWLIDATDTDSRRFLSMWEICCNELEEKGVEVSDDGLYHWDLGNSPLRWRSPIHMPRWASRLTLEVTDVRVQRVQDISEADAWAEGVKTWRAGWGLKEQAGFFLRDKEAIGATRGGSVSQKLFCLLWESIHGPGAWHRNDWAAAYTFKVHQMNVDEFLKQRTAT